MILALPTLDDDTFLVVLDEFIVESLEIVRDRLTDSDRAFEARLRDRATDTDIPIVYGEVVSHDIGHAIVNYATDTGADALILEQQDSGFPETIVGGSLGWVEDHAPCDVVEVSEYDPEDIETVAVVSDGVPYGAAIVAIADAIAHQTNATLAFYYPVGAGSTESHRATIENYLAELGEVCDAPVRTHIVEHDDGDAMDAARTNEDLLVVSGTHGGFRDRLLGNIDSVDRDGGPPSIVVFAADRPGRVRQKIEGRLF